MGDLVFADANFLLYVRDEREPEKQARASTWHDRLWRDRVGRISMQVVSEYYVNLKRMAGRRLTAEEAWQAAEAYLAWGPREIDAELLRSARAIEQRYRISWWDSMIVAAAQLQECGILLTEDLQDGAVFGTVTVRSPFTLELRQPAAAYAARPLVARLHRPRGRPPRTALA